MSKLRSILATCGLLLAVATGMSAVQAADVAGYWMGTYTYSEAPPNMPIRFLKFELLMVNDGDKVTGVVKESNTFGSQDAPWLYGDVKGASDGNRLAFVKTYDGTGGQSHNVNYKGTVGAGGTRVDGEWSIPGSWGGSFSLTKMKDTGGGPNTGWYSGEYSYPPDSGKAPVPFRMIVVRNGARMAGLLREKKTFGAGNEPWLHAVSNGQFDSRGVTFFKAYDGTGEVIHDVLYRGKMSGNSVIGEWMIPGSWHGPFKMTKE